MFQCFIRLASLFAIVLLSSISCSGVRQVTPLNKGESRVNLSLGGPFTDVGGVTIPLPFLNAAYCYGIQDNLGIEAGINITSGLYGTLALDAGVNWHTWKAKQMIPGLYIAPRLFFTTRFDDFEPRLFPTLDLGIYWEVMRHHFYGGLDNWFEFHNERTDGNPQEHHWLIAPYIGYGLTHKQWQYQLEGRVYTPNLKNSGRATKNVGFGEYGVLGIFLGVSYNFGGKQ